MSWREEQPDGIGSAPPSSSPEHRWGARAPHEAVDDGAREGGGGPGESDEDRYHDTSGTDGGGGGSRNDSDGGDGGEVSVESVDVRPSQSIDYDPVSLKEPPGLHSCEYISLSIEVMVSSRIAANIKRKHNR